MDRATFELMADVRLADLYRDAEMARLVAAVGPRRRPPLILPAFGDLLIRAGHWLQQLGTVCPECPAPAHP